MVEKGRLAGIIAAAATAAMFYFGTGLHPVWWLTWFAPVPVLVAAVRLGGWASFGVAGVAWVAGGLNMWSYYRASLHIPLPLVLVILVLPACVFGLVVRWWRALMLRGSSWKAALALPAAWVTYEYLSSVISPHSTAGNLGYSQMDCLPVLEVTALAGIWGISFCLFLLAGSLGAVLARPASAGWWTVAAGVILVAVFGYGLWRLGSAPVPEGTVSVGLVAAGADNPVFRRTGAIRDLLHDYSEEIAKLAGQGAWLIVLPEKIAIVPDQKMPEFDGALAAAARGAGVSVVAGVDRGGESRRWNEARLYSPDGAVVATYDKHHLVPVFEAADQAATGITVLKEPPGVWGIEICKDMDFPELSRQYGARGVGLMIVPAWDFVVDGWLHGRMAILRGVESGFTIVRAASEGRLTVSDDRGRVLAEQSSETARLASLAATAPVRHTDTLYVRWGDWFAWLNIAGLAGLIAGSRMRRAAAPSSV